MGTYVVIFGVPLTLVCFASIRSQFVLVCAASCDVQDGGTASKCDHFFVYRKLANREGLQCLTRGADFQWAYVTFPVR